MPITGRSSRQRYNAWKTKRLSHHSPTATAIPSNNRSPRTRSFAGLIRAFWGLLYGYRRTLAAALGTLSISTILGLYPPYATKLIFDHVLSDNPPERGAFLERLTPDPLGLLFIICSVVLVTTTSAMLVGIWGRWQCTRLVKRVQVGLRKRVFDHAARLPLDRVQSIKSGGVASVLREDAGGVGDLIFSLVYNPWRALTQLVGTLTILAFIDWRMLIGSLVLLPAIWFSHRTWIGRIRPMFRDIRTTRQNIDTHATESFGGMRVVRGFNREHAESMRFTTNGNLMARQEFRAWWWSRSLEMIWQLLVPLATVAVLVYFGRGVLNGDRTTGELIAFLLYLGWLLGPIESLVSSATNVQNQLAGLDRVIDLMDEPREFANSTPTREVSRQRTEGRITLERMSFVYPTPRGGRRSSQTDSARLGDAAVAHENAHADTPTKEPSVVLHEIDLDVAPGETIALVGPSGSGKTTLCNLVARFYDPTEGRILLDGVDLKDITPESYRRLLGIVEQDVFLFDGSIAENIAYARRDTTEAQIIDAAKTANAHGFVTALEHGYGTLVGERGVRLSGGQKQRIAIARAVLADPRILILDEATSSLDSESERLIQRSLAELMQGRTTFVIAHRLSTIRHADRIVVLENGRIREISGMANSIAAAVEEQGAATQEIVRNVAEAATGTESVTANVSGVAGAAEETGAAAAQVLASASEIGRAHV